MSSSIPKQTRSIYNTFSIDSDFIDFGGGEDGDIHFSLSTGHESNKFVMEGDTEIPAGKNYYKKKYTIYRVTQF